MILAPSLLESFRERWTRRWMCWTCAKLDLRSTGEAFDWYREKGLPAPEPSDAGCGQGCLMYDVFRDYLIACKIPTFWLPGEGDDDWSGGGGRGCDLAL